MPRVRVRAFSFRQTHVCICIARQMEVSRAIAYMGPCADQNRVFTFDHISSLLLCPLSPPLVLLRCCHGNGRELSDWLRPSFPPRTVVLLLKLPISLSDPLERRRRRLCEYILINKNGRALRRERKGGSIGGKYDVSKGRVEEIMLHFIECTLQSVQSFVLTPGKKTLSHTKRRNIDSE